MLASLCLFCAVQSYQPQSPPTISSGAPNSNDVTLHNGSDVVYPFSEPSIGSSVGTNPPDVNSDMYWKVLPGDRIMAHHHGAFPGTSVVTIDGYLEQLFDTDWGTPADFYDRTHGPSMPAGGCVLEPAFFQLGFTSEVVVSLGNSGLPDPCLVNPSLCSPIGSGCPPMGFVNGWSVDITFVGGGGVSVDAFGGTSSDLVTTYFVPGGMSLNGGPCGDGDYALQTAYSTNETPFDDCAGVSEFSGRRIAFSPTLPDPYTETPTNIVTFEQAILNVRAESVVPGVQVSNNGGGALNALKVDRTPLGGAFLSAEIRDQDMGLQPNVSFVYFDLTPTGPPGLFLLPDGYLLLTPFALPMPCTGTVFTPTFFSAGTTEGVWTTCPIFVTPAIPPPGTDVYWQGFSLNPVTYMLRSTNRVRTTLY